jgi:hypothetical protein
LQPLARRHPDQETLRQELASLHGDKATALCCLARFDDAEREWALADDLATPPSKWYFRACRANERVRAGDVQRGADDAAALMLEENLEAPALIVILGLYARCLASQTDPDLVAAGSDRWLTSAVSCLERLAAVGYFRDPRRVFGLYADPALQTVRASEPFVAWLDALGEPSRNSPECALVEADSLRLAGVRRLEWGEVDQAIAGLSRGIEAARRLSLGSSAIFRDARFVLEGLYWNRARAHAAAGLTREAIADLKEAAAFDTSPGRASTRIALGRVLFEGRRIAEAAAVLREVAAEPELSAGDAYDLAILSAQIRGSFNPSELSASADIARLDRELFDQVMSSLNRALAGGFFESTRHRDEVRSNAYLIVFRGRPEFESLLARLPTP